ncbi:MAG: hypothetical protein WDO16_12900 [Bacteroidota bacterium]
MYCLSGRRWHRLTAIVAEDIDGDGNIDMLIAGNEYQVAANTGRYDASYGLLLKGNGKGDFVPVTGTGERDNYRW